MAFELDEDPTKVRKKRWQRARSGLVKVAWQSIENKTLCHNLSIQKSEHLFLGWLTLET